MVKEKKNKEKGTKKALDVYSIVISSSTAIP